MIRRILYIVPGHGHKRPAVYDPGARAGDFQEAESVRKLADAMKTALSAVDVEVVIDGEGEYAARHARAGKLLAAAQKKGPAVMAIVHLHHNASTDPAPKYALAMHDRRSGGGQALAEAIAAELAELPVFGRRCDVVATYDDRKKAGEKAWLFNAFYCTDEVYKMADEVSACLVEAGFVSHPRTRTWFLSEDGYEATAAAIAAGVLTWLARKVEALAA